MAVTGRKSFLLTTALLLSAFAWPTSADQSADLRRTLSDVATALASGHPALAMDSFDKDAFTGYDKLSGFFENLAGAYQVDSQLDITDEESTATTASLTVHWVLTLTDPVTNLDQRRDADLTVKLAKKLVKKNLGKTSEVWRIVAMEPLDLFDPQMKRRP